MIHGLEQIDYEAYEPDIKALAKADREEPFAEAAFELLKDAGETVTITVCLEELDENGALIALPRDAAIVGALLVRCMKITHGLLQNASDRRMELLNLFTRPLIESAVNLRFLIECGTPEVFDDFVRYSLQTERRLRTRIEAHIVEAGGEVSPIQRRILSSISRNFERSGVRPDDSPTGAWPTKIFDRFDRLGLNDQYLFQFAVQSHYMHGNWHDLYSYHLRAESGGFALDRSWGDVRPQPLLAATLVLAQAASQYLEVALPASPQRGVLIGRLDKCITKVRRVAEAHESFLRMA